MDRGDKNQRDSFALGLPFPSSGVEIVTGFNPVEK